ncbi:MAG TPA: M13 family metallopeptidase [Bryobacteraceae bacterium]|nr:M13 family metallopeptidase [Bryobacteraceae bacterium]
MRVLALIAILCAAALAQPPVGFDPSSLDRTVDPCVNFYQFACGGWQKANPRPADQGSWGSFDVLQERNRIVLHNILEGVSSARTGRTAIEQKIGDYFAACMDEKAIDAKGIAALKADLDVIAAIRNKPGVTDAVIHLYKIGSAPFFRFGSEPDPKNSTTIIANVDQGGLGLPDRDYYFREDEKSVDLRKKYLAHLHRIFELLGESPAEAAKKKQVVMRIETTLAKGSLDRVARRDPNNVYHKLTTAELISLAPGFDWQKFFDATGSPKFDSLDVSVPPFVRAMESVIVENSLDDLKTYLVWNLVIGMRGNLPTAFEREIFDFYGKNLGGAKEMRARWKRCTDQVDNQLPDALGRMFVEKTLGDEGKRRMQQMVDALEKALERDIKALDWMTDKTKEQALIKLHAIINKVGTKANWMDYTPVEIARNDAYGNAARTSLFELHRQLAKIGKPLDKTDWAMSQPTVNAYYDPQENDINFPAGILQPPFYDNKMDDAVNYGAIGAVIGHELTHGFDDQGRQFDAQGNLRDWWTEEDAKAFEKRAQCLVDQYAGFTAVDNVKLNGKLTLGENTADNGGLRIAYMALMDTLAGKQPPKRDGFSAEQRLFLGWAQVWCTNQSDESARTQAQSNEHSTGQFRVNGVVQNMPEFQKAFACKAGQPMVKSPACRVW